MCSRQKNTAADAPFNANSSRGGEAIERVCAAAENSPPRVHHLMSILLVGVDNGAAGRMIGFEGREARGLVLKQVDK